MKKTIFILLAAGVSLAVVLIGTAVWMNHSAQMPEFIVSGDHAEDISVMENKSYFHDFTIDGSSVYFRCAITVKNNGEKTCFFTVNARDEEDYQNGLLANPALLGVKEPGAEQERVYTVYAGETLGCEVLLKGEWSGREKTKNDRMLPAMVEICLLP